MNSFVPNIKFLIVLSCKGFNDKFIFALQDCQLDEIL